MAKKKWMKPRHKIIQNLARLILGPYCKWKYGITVEKFKEEEERPYLILYNHQTGFDQFFVGLSFKSTIYYLATEDIFSMGFVSDLLRFAVEPIPIKKQTTDVGAVMNCLRVAREGGTICIAPEGNRTFSGRTAYINPAIAVLAKKIRVPVVLYKIEGGFGAQPRWSDCVRKGKMRSYVSEVIMPEEYSAMTDEEFVERIRTGLFVDEAKADGIFKSKKTAEHIERSAYVCPFCGFAEFESHGNEIECKSCKRKIVYGEDKRLLGKGFDFPFEFYADWYDYQEDFVNKTDVLEYTENPIFTDKVKIDEVIIRKKKVSFKNNVELKLYGDRLVADEGTENEMVLPYPELSAVSVLGKNKLNIYHNAKVYQITGGKSFNALKYVNIYYRWKNITEGNIDGKFLGL